MLYSPSDPRDYLAALDRLNWARDNHKTLNITLPRKSRTTQQNRYYHLCLRWYAHNIGLTETAAEYDFKARCNRSIFLIEVKDKHGRTHTALRSSSDLTTQEMASAIANFRDYASLYAGIDLPLPDDDTALRFIERETEGNNYI